MSFTINPAIFREYDIRGIAGEDLCEEFAENLGLAYAEAISQRTPAANRSHLTVSVGEDCRISSPSYAKAVANGLAKGGIDVVLLGTCPTPVAYFSLFHLDLDGGIMVTASHLAANHNGFKLCVGRDSIYGDSIQQLRKIMERGPKGHPGRQGELSACTIIPDYLNYVVGSTKLEISKNIVIDCGNGNGSQVVPEIFRRLNAEVTELYCEMDGTFPNHIPDPSVPANLANLIAKVKETQADFGIGIDGDADRIGVVDETGKILYGDDLLVIFSRDILRKHPGATIVSEVKSSFKLFSDIEKRGGKPLMWKTGHSLIETKMKETKALLGGEVSGHMFFADRYFGYDDAAYTAMRTYEIAASHPGPFSSLLSGLPHTVSTPELRIACPDNEKFGIVDRVRKHFCTDPKMKKEKITLLDGIRVDFAYGWGLLRASNTEPVLSMRFEAYTLQRMEEIKGIFESAIEVSKR
jgi:phosphomannomutase/phosphoglucomutase